MRNFLIACLLTLSFNAFTQQRQHEFSVFIRNGVALNKSRLSVNDVYHSGFTITEVKNTLLQSIGATYSVIGKKHLLFSTGVDLGIDRYRININFPFAAYGFQEPQVGKDKYKINANIPYAAANVMIGYRFQNLSSLCPEFRIGQIVHVPLKSVNIYDISEEYRDNGDLYVNYKREAVLGKRNEEFVLELVNALYVGINGPKATKFSRFAAGLQFQKQLILKNNGMNTFEARYDDSNGFTRSEESFKSYHNSISFIIGYKF